MRRSHISPAAAAAIAVGSATFAAPPQPLDADEAALVALFGDAVSLTAIDVEMDLDEILRATVAAKETEFLVLHGPGTGGSLHRSVKAVGRAPAHWPDSGVPPVAVTIPGRSVMYLFLDAKGSIVAETQLDLEQAVLVTFTPGEMRVPHQGVPDPYQMKVKVWDLHDPGDLEHEGTMNVVARNRGTWRVKTPAGEFDCLMLRLDYDGKVGPASVKDTNLRFISPEVGLVASVEGKRVSAMIFYNTDTRIALALKDPPPQARATPVKAPAAGSRPDAATR